LYSREFFEFQLSQGSVATLIRWGGWRSNRHIYRSFKKLTVKTALKSVDIFTRSQTKTSWLLFMAHSVYRMKLREPTAGLGPREVTTSSAAGMYTLNIFRNTS